MTDAYAELVSELADHLKQHTTDPFIDIPAVLRKGAEAAWDEMPDLAGLLDDTADLLDERLTGDRCAVLERETDPLAGQLEEYAALQTQGLGNREIAKRMFVHHRTAEKYGKRLRADAAGSLYDSLPAGGAA